MALSFARAVKTVALTGQNNVDSTRVELSIGGVDGDVWITYENSSGTCSYIYSLDNGRGFSSAVNIGGGSSH